MIPTTLVPFLPYLMYALVGIFFLLGGIIGFLRGSKKSAVKLAISLVLVVVSVFVTLFLAPWIWENMFYESLMPQIDAFITGNETMRELFETSATLDGLTENIVLAIVGPILFMLVYSVLGVVAWLVFAIGGLFAIIGRHGKQKKNLASRGGGFLIGGLKGLVFAFVLLVPICGLLGLVNSALVGAQDENGALPEMLASYNVTLAENPENPDEPITVLSLAEDILQSPVCGTVRTLGGNALFGTLTRFEVTTGTEIVDGVETPVKETVRLADELDVILRAIGAAMPLVTTDIGEYGEAQSNGVHNVTALLGESTILPNMMSEVLSAACTKWDAGEPFLGKEAPTTEDADVNALMSDFFSAFKSTDKTTIRADLNTLADVIDVMIQHKAFGIFFPSEDEEATEGETTIIDALASEGMVTDLMTVLYQNPHTAPLCATVANLGVKAISVSLNLPVNADGIYADLMADIATAVNGLPTEGDRNAALKPLLETAFAKSGYEINDSLLTAVTTSLCTKFPAGTTTATADSIKAFFAEQDAAANGGDGAPVLNAGTEPTINTVWSQLSSPQKFVTTIVTAADIAIKKEHVANITDAETEFSNIEKSFTLMLDYNASLSTDIKKIDLASLGAYFDAIRVTALYGPVSPNLLTLMLDMETLKQTNFVTAEVKSALFAALADKEASMKRVLTAAQNVAIIAVNVKDGADSAAAVADLVKCVDAKSAPYVKSMVTPAFIQKQGLSADRAEALANSVCSILDGVINSNADLDHPATLDKETVAIQNLIGAAGKIDSTEPLFDSNNTAGDFLDSMLTSDVVMSSITGESAPDLSAKMIDSPADQTAFVNALALRYAEQGLGADTPEAKAEKAKLDAAAAVFGFTDNGTGTYTFSYTGTIKDISGSEFVGHVNGDYTFVPGTTARPPKSAIVITDNTDPENPKILSDGNFTIKGFINSGVAGTATVVVEGSGRYTGEMQITYTIAAADISTIAGGTVNGTYTYTGEPVDVAGTDIVVTMGDYTLVFGTDFTIVGLTGNDAAGEASVTIRGCGNFTGELTIPFTIA